MNLQRCPLPMLPIPLVLLEFSSHQLEVAETLIQVGRFVVIFLAARAIAEVMVRLQFHDPR